MDTPSEDAHGHYTGPVDIYLLTAPDGKRYVGQTQRFTRNGRSKWKRHGLEKRFAENVSAKRHQSLLRASLDKHGGASFTKEILVIVPKAQANHYETVFIEAYNTTGPIGLNMTTGGYYAVATSASRQLMSNFKRNRGSYTKEYRAILSAAARKRPKESDLPTYIVEIAPRGTNAAGYRSQVWHANKCHVREFTAKKMSMETKLEKAVRARDATMSALGMPPL